MEKARLAAERQLLSVTGRDAQRFLHDLVSNDIERMGQGLTYAALLSPQGKYLFDFLIARHDGGFLLDVAGDRAAALAGRLAMYRLRAEVAIAPSPLAVVMGIGAPPAGAWPDPRDPGLGWRLFTPDPGPVLAGRAGWSAEALLELRLSLGVPESGVELIPEQTYVLEAGFERLNGVSFRKGCYVGQEVTARMKHKTNLRKGLVRMRSSGNPQPGPLTDGAGNDLGTLFSFAGGYGLAQLRHERSDGPLMAGETEVFTAPVSP